MVNPKTKVSFQALLVIKVKSMASNTEPHRVRGLTSCRLDGEVTGMNAHFCKELNPNATRARCEPYRHLPHGPGQRQEQKR